MKASLDIKDSLLNIMAILLCGISNQFPSLNAGKFSLTERNLYCFEIGARAAIPSIGLQECLESTTIRVPYILQNPSISIWYPLIRRIVD